MSDVFVHSAAVMGTVVTVQVVGHGADEAERAERQAAIDEALGWFRQVEQACTRFDPASELMRLTQQIGHPVVVSPLLYEAVRFALIVAEETGGAFDPTVGHRMAERGFNREYRSGEVVPSSLPIASGGSFRDVLLNPAKRTITLRRPLILDLGAAAKGLAIDLAARSLEDMENFLIDAGGDLYVGGHNATGRPWSIGIKHPRDPGALIEKLSVSDLAVCTSGDYERRTPAGQPPGHHILDPRDGTSANAVASVTVVAPSALVADVLATAVFVLGPVDGLALLERHGIEGLILTPALERHATPGLPLIA